MRPPRTRGPDGQHDRKGNAENAASKPEPHTRGGDGARPTPVTTPPADARTPMAAAARRRRGRHGDRPAVMAKTTSPTNVATHAARVRVIESASSARQAALSQR